MSTSGGVMIKYHNTIIKMSNTTLRNTNLIIPHTQTVVILPSFNPLMLNVKGKCHGTVQTKTTEDFSLLSHVCLKPRDIAQRISTGQPMALAPGPYF